MRNRYFLSFCFVLAMFAQLSCLAQTTEDKPSAQKTSHHITVGYNFGATAPYSLPNTIRKIERYGLLFTPSIGYEVHRSISGRWGIGSGLRLDVKGMDIKDSVQYFHTILQMDGAEFEGDFTGTNQTTAKNTYLTVPLNGTYLTGRWRFGMGAYIGYALSRRFKGSVSDGYIRKGNSLGEKVQIDESKFDFSDQVKRWDWGLHALIARNVGEGWSINLNAQTGIEPIFPGSFRGVGYKLRNINLNLGATFNIQYF